MMQNRTFILGLIFLFFGVFGLEEHIVALKNQTWVFSAWNVLSFIGDCMLLYLGFVRIESTTE
jgi:hypothetical protein